VCFFVCGGVSGVVVCILHGCIAVGHGCVGVVGRYVIFGVCYVGYVRGSRDSVAGGIVVLVWYYQTC